MEGVGQSNYLATVYQPDLAAAGQELDEWK